MPENINPFYLKRKAERFKGKNVSHIEITSIEKVGHENVQCIKVDNPEHLYLTDDFIVFAKTSQFVRDRGEGLTGIKTNCKESIPTNISAVRKYRIEKEDDNFLNYGNNNSKNLYLLLLEDL